MAAGGAATGAGGSGTSSGVPHRQAKKKTMNIAELLGATTVVKATLGVEARTPYRGRSHGSVAIS